MNYRGRKPKGGLSAGQVCVVAIVAMVLVLAMTLKAGAQWTGQTASEQIYTALFVAKDWE